MLAEGDAVPEFTAKTGSGETISNATLHGKKTVLYFYPKDETAGCTIEACNFRDDAGAIAAAGAQIIGVSMDDAATHQEFARKFALTFPLIADVDHGLADCFGVFDPERGAERPWAGVRRATFVIDEAGVVRRAFGSVNRNLADHSQEVVEALQSL